jgi:hypothetical protein
MIIRLGNTETTISINPPKHGYIVDVNMALSITRAKNGAVSSFDNGSANDFRICSDVTFDLSAAEMVALVDLLSTAGRGAWLYIELGSTPTGFFPAGPDKGDTGNFLIRLLDIKSGGMQFQPWKYFNPTLSFLASPVFTYTRPSELAEGDFQIGSVQNLRYPQSGINPAESFDVKTIVTRSGWPYSMDRGVSADSFDTSFTMDCSHSKAAALVAHLTAAVRGNAVPITVPADSYLFGAKQASAGTFNSLLTSPTIKVTHNTFDEFGIDLNLWMKP